MAHKLPAREPIPHLIIANEITPSFGQLLWQLRQRAGMTIDDLAAAVGYHRSHISNLEKGKRLPDLATVLEKFIPALGLQDEPHTARQIVELAAVARGENLPAAMRNQLAAGLPIVVETEWVDRQLPVPMTPIFGRERDIIMISNRLLGHTGRLFTLMGPPGIGKTTLALTVAVRLQASFADGIYFVPLSTTTEPDRIGSAMMAVLGLTEGGQNSKPPKVRLIEYLRRKKVLLVLDNFEQITAAAPLLVELLSECLGLCLLVTSRAALCLRIEQRFKVPALDLTAAIELFVQRVQAIEPDFVLTAQNIAIIEQICTRLDCLPLAIELIAARVDLFTPQALLSRLQNQSLDLLHNDAPDLEARHRTLRYAIQQSYALLNTEEQTLFRTLGVFAGSFELASVEAIHALQGASTKTEQLLSSLLNKSLIQAETQSNERRFKLLETLRTYALEQLILQDELERAHRLHAAYFCAFAETANLALYGPDEIYWLDRLTLEYANLRAALTWSFTLPQFARQDDVEIGLRLVGALWWFWYVRNYHSEAKVWLQRALTCDSSKMPALRAKILQGAALLAWAYRGPGDRQISSDLVDESIALYRQVKDQRNLARSLAYLSLSAKTYADYAPAAEEAKCLFRQVNDLWGIAWMTNWEYYVMQPEGQHLPVKEAVALFREIGGKSSLAFALLVQARHTYAKGDLVLARASIEEAVVLYRQVGHKWQTAHCLSFLGDLLRCQHEFSDVAAIYEEASLLAQQSGDSYWGALIRYNQGLLAHLQGADSHAVQHFKEALVYYQQHGPQCEGKYLRQFARISPGGER